MPFFMVSKDITLMDVDAIVNAANNELLAGGGVCGAIFAAAGAEKMTAACREIGYCATGDAVITQGFGLKARYVIHTVGPIYGRDRRKEARQLSSCYETSLKLAEQHRLSSVAFPLISSGIYGYPKEEAMKIAKQAIFGFLEHSEMTVYLVLYDAVFDPRQTNRVREFLDRNLRSQRMFVPTASAPAAPAVLQTQMDRETSLDDLLSRRTETFSQLLLRTIDRKGMSDVEVYKRANLDRKLFSKIRKKEYVPKKRTVMALVIALRLDMDEARELLARAGYAFSEANQSDLIIEYFIMHRNYDIFALNETLFAFDQQLLGGE